MTTLNWRKPLDKRFWSKVSVTDGCWLWNGTTDKDGYGLLHNTDRPPAFHRATHISWMLHGKGDVPDDRQMCHTCDNPACVRPDHLWIGTTQENTADRGRKGRTSRHSRIDPPRGEQHPMARLKENDVRAILALRHSGLRQGDIAARFGISQANVWRILKGETWRHIQ
jgi:hypothetical protein